MKKLLIICIVSLNSVVHSQIIPQPSSYDKGKGVIQSRIIVPRGHSPIIQKSIDAIPLSFLDDEGLELEVIVSKPLLALPTFKIDESYVLRTIPKKITIEAANEYGALHGIESLKQLISLEGGVRKGLSIKDAPRFPWRGLLIDVARNWISLDTLKTQINLMATVKLNVLHLHLSDDQAFRVESFKFPKLHTNNWDKKYFTQKEIQELIAYAGERGIRVVPEFDVPGHAASIIAAYPELAALKGSNKPSQKYGPHDESMNPIIPETYVFLENLFQEMAALFPDEFFHVGGDEVTGKHWQANPEIVRYMKDNNLKDTAELQFVFTKKMEALIQKLGKKMIAWDEVLKEKETLNSVAQIWRGPKFANQAISMKMPVIFSYGYYLDLQLSSEQHYSIDPANEMGLKSDPSLLWGGEACMWSERITDGSTTHRIWPRAMAVAERLWSPRTIIKVEDFYERERKLSQHLGLKNFELDDRTAQEARRLSMPSELFSELFSWLEPGKFYSQHRYRTITTKTSWDMWVDLMPSESLQATKLNWLYEKWLKTKSPESLKELETVIASWGTLHTNFTAAAVKDFKEKEDLLVLAKDMGVLSRMATDALSYLKTTERPPGLWVLENQTKLGMTGQIRSGMKPAMHHFVEKLVNRVAIEKAQLY